MGEIVMLIILKISAAVAGMPDYNTSIIALKYLLSIIAAALGVLALYIFDPSWFSRRISVAKALRARLFVREAMGDKALEDAVRDWGFLYDRKQDIFYSSMNPWQRKCGYCREYDELCAPMGMIVDSEPVYFYYGGKNWLVELWKGQYDLTTGCEVGVYTKEGPPLSRPADAFYNCAANKDRLFISFVLKKKGKALFTRADKHWWLTGFMLGEFSEPSELVLETEITFKNGKMKESFLQALKKIGYTEKKYWTFRNTVGIVFDKPYSAQPSTRSPLTDRVIQDKNYLLCKTFVDAVSSAHSLSQKMDALKKASPELLGYVSHIGKPRQILESRMQQAEKAGGGKADGDVPAKHKRKDDGKAAESAKLKDRAGGKAADKGKRKKPADENVAPKPKDSISRVYRSAKQIEIDDSSKIVLMSDCHRGDGSWSDDFAKNQNLYFYALTYYYERDYTYIELGDGDELWENKRLSDIKQAHVDVYWLLAKFFKEGRLHLIYGNHDSVKKKAKFVRNNLSTYYDEHEKKCLPLFECIEVSEGLVLNYAPTNSHILLIHGHQGDLLNDRLCCLAKFLVRYFWRPLGMFGVLNPTSPAKNYNKKQKVSGRLIGWAKREKTMLIAGHTHKPVFPDVGEPLYFNDGSCIHPRCVTAIEISGGNIRLVKWSLKTDDDASLYVGKDILAGPVPLREYFEAAPPAGAIYGSDPQPPPGPSQ